MPKKIFILVHGAWHGNWCWKKMIPLLEAKGLEVIAPNFPEINNDEKDFTQIGLQTYVDQLKKIISQCEGKVILVGHSAGGAIISEAASNMPEKIERLIYIAAFIPAKNSSIQEEAQKSHSSKLGKEFLFNKENNSIDLKKSDRLKKIFYNDCSDEDAIFAMKLLKPQPAKLFSDKIVLSENFKSIQKIYIACQNDYTVPYELQIEMAKANDCEVINLATGHSPFFSCPERVVEIF